MSTFSFSSKYANLLVLVNYRSYQFGLLSPKSTQQFYQHNRVNVVLLGSPLYGGHESSVGRTVFATYKELHSLRISLYTVLFSVHVQKTF